jgi:hypothetical protein
MEHGTYAQFNLINRTGIITITERVPSKDSHILGGRWYGLLQTSSPTILGRVQRYALLSKAIRQTDAHWLD